MELPSQLTIEMADGSSVILGEELTLPSNGSLTRGLAVSPGEGSCVVEHLSYRQEESGEEEEESDEEEEEELWYWGGMESDSDSD